MKYDNRFICYCNVSVVFVYSLRYLFVFYSYYRYMMECDDTSMMMIRK